jgi:hypothetical protein
MSDYGTDDLLQQRHILAPENDDEEVETEEDEEIAKEFPVSSEPEIIATLPLDTPLAAEPEDTTPHLTSTVCDVCLELNLTTKAQVICCERCEQAFCFHYASSVDTRYCVNCLSDISVTKQVISKEYVHRDEENKVTSVYRRKAREVKIGGCSWLFAQRKIAEISDVELDLTIEYHRNILMLQIDEQERRRNAKMHRYANTPYKIPTPSTTTVSNSTTTTVKKTKTVSKDKAAEQLAAILGAMAASGKKFDMNAVAAVLKGVGK